MQRWLPRILHRIGELVAENKVSFTFKARYELAVLQLGFDEQDACDLLASLTVADSAGRLISRTTGEWLYVFKPRAGGVVLYVKLIVRSNCIVVSFHEDEGDAHEQDA
jgi:hypothetical protein